MPAQLSRAWCKMQIGYVSRHMLQPAQVVDCAQAALGIILIGLGLFEGAGMHVLSVHNTERIQLTTT